jgi:hypothetical protein
LKQGRELSRQTYVEGLDLLRQRLTAEDAKEFIDIVLSRWQVVPKELLWIARAIGYHSVLANLEKSVGGELP